MAKIEKMLQKYPDFDDVKEKINELCDIINTIQKEREAERFEIQEWIDILEAVRKSVNIHEKEIDELQMKVEPEKCEIPAENVQDDEIEQAEKWIGKLCWFSQLHGCRQHIAILKRVSESGLYVTDDGELHYAYCEPVKPDDEIIYKGE